jgi:HSP20 family protein
MAEVKVNKGEQSAQPGGQQGGQQGGTTSSGSPTGQTPGQAGEMSSGQSPAGGMQRGGAGGRGGYGGGYGMTRRESPLESLFSLSPRDFFSANPFELMQRFSDEFNRLAEGFGLSRGGFSQSGGRPGGQMGGQMSGPITGLTGQMSWAPAVEISERGNNLVICAELPGLSKDDVNVEVTDEGLIISGERKRQHEERREGYYRTERSYGNFYRFIPLGENFDTEQARAEFNNGVLEITIPMPATEQRRRQIPIGEGGQRGTSQGEPQGGQTKTAGGF